MDFNLEKSASAWAKKLAEGKCKLERSKEKSKDRGGVNGENGWEGGWQKNLSTRVVQMAEHAIDSWFNEVAKYQYGWKECNASAQNLTQMMWTGTKRVGCTSTQIEKNAANILLSI